LCLGNLLSFVSVWGEDVIDTILGRIGIRIVLYSSEAHSTFVTCSVWLVQKQPSSMPHLFLKVACMFKGLNTIFCGYLIFTRHCT
jgi:hypothetical protein